MHCEPYNKCTRNLKGHSPQYRDKHTLPSVQRVNGTTLLCPDSGGAGGLGWAGAEGNGHKKFTTAVLALDIKHHINSEDLFLNL